MTADEQPPRAGTITAPDLALLRRLALGPGGFSQPAALLARLRQLLADSPQLEPPSTTLLEALDPAVCHRKLLWSLVLGVPLHASRKKEEEEAAGETTAEAHRDERQVELDINRSFVYYPQREHPPGFLIDAVIELRTTGQGFADISAPVKQELRATLSRVIVTILRRFPKLNYFQGYHDIVSIFLLNFLALDPDQASGALDGPARDEDLWLLEETVQKFTLHRIRDSLTSDLSPIMGYLRYTQVLLEQEDPGLAALISQSSSLPLFSLSWILTLTAHDLRSLGVVSRVFDFLLCHPPVMICYLACAICLSKTAEVAGLVREAEAEGGPVDLDLVHLRMAALPPLTMDDGDDGPGKEEADERGSADVDGPAEEPRAGEEEDRGLPVDALLRSTLALYGRHRPGEARLKLATIMGPMSCIHTWPALCTLPASGPGSLLSRLLFPRPSFVVSLQDRLSASLFVAK
ncbi:hypothetical protein PtB15_2B379 [Puccinia triticina]|nr:hypothetical protein PtB15_2B379 [Puccinia triticina]